jgi:hypothetical protein
MIHQHQFRSLHYTFSDSAVTVIVVPAVVVTTVSVMEVAVVPTVAVAVVLLQ